MLERPSPEPNPQNKTKFTDEQNNGSLQNSVQFTEFPDELLLLINDHLPTGKDTMHLTFVNKRLGLFQPEIGKKEAIEAGEYAIYPVEKGENNAEVGNITKLKALLKACPALLLHPVTVMNRHGQVIQGTPYQIALHECDDELVADVIKPAFERLRNGLEMMETRERHGFRMIG